MNSLFEIGVLICAFAIIIGIIIYSRNQSKRLIKTLKQKWGKEKIEKRNFDLIQSFHEIIEKDKYYQVLDKQTCKDLNFDAVYSFLDRTMTTIGQQYLYHKLKSMNSSIDDLKRFGSLVDYFMKNEETRLKIQVILNKLNSKSAYYIPDLLGKELLEKPKWFWIVPALSLLPIVLIITSLFYPYAMIFLLVIFILNSVLHYRNKYNLYMYSQSLPQLIILLDVSSKITSFKLTGTNFEFMNKQIKKLKLIKRKLFFANLENSFKNELLIPFYAVLEIIKSLFLIELISLFGALKTIKENRKSLIEVFKYIGDIDSAISTASLREGIEICCTPSFITSNKKLSISNARHPLVNNCIPNNISIKNKGILITGSNMSGKTTFIRTVALNALFAQTIYTCIADTYTAPFMKIYSSITIQDDITKGKSYYLEEVERIHYLIENSNKNEACLIIIDEVFKGTNTTERIAAAKGILNSLHKGQNIILVSTHDVELIEYLKENYEMYHFEETVENNTLIFDHKLKEGPFTTRNAIKILEMYNYPKEILHEAKEIIE